MNRTAASPAPAISVVMPAFGRPVELGETLDALGRQDLDRPDFEVIVVDDGSAESLEPVAMSRAPALPLRYIRHSQNRGRAAARNTGARAARGEFLLFLDADMRASPGLVRAHLETLRRGSPAGARESLVVLGPIPLADGYGSILGRYMERRGHMRPGIDATDVPHRYFVSANTSLARALFERAGGYDERFVHYGGEDIDLGWTLRATGARFVVAPGAVAQHCYRYELASGARRMREFGRDTLPLVFDRHPELRQVFHLDLVTSRGPLAAALFRAMTAPALLAGGATLAARLGRFARPIVSYVLVGNYFRGYLEYLAARGAERGAGTTVSARR